MTGLLHVDNVLLMQKKKNLMEEGKSYYYNLGFTDGEDVLLITAGALGDTMTVGKKYNLRLDFLDKKLKLRGAEESTLDSDVARAGLDSKQKK